MPIRIESQVSTNYHCDRIADGLLSHLERFISAELAAQLPDPADDIHGTLTPCYNEEKYCGPNSAVKDVYRLDLSFRIGTETVGTFKDDIRHEPVSQGFVPRYKHRKLLVITQARRLAQKKFSEAVHALCRRICEAHIREATCPKCSATLKIIDAPALFDVSCPERCFNYNFHRDPSTGEFQHGHVFFAQTDCQSGEGSIDKS